MPPCLPVPLPKPSRASLPACFSCLSDTVSHVFSPIACCLFCFQHQQNTASFQSFKVPWHQLFLCQGLLHKARYSGAWHSKALPSSPLPLSFLVSLRLFMPAFLPFIDACFSVTGFSSLPFSFSSSFLPSLQTGSLPQSYRLLFSSAACRLFSSLYCHCKLLSNASRPVLFLAASHVMPFTPFVFCHAFSSFSLLPHVFTGTNIII